MKRTIDTFESFELEVEASAWQVEWFLIAKVSAFALGNENETRTIRRGLEESTILQFICGKTSQLFWGTHTSGKKKTVRRKRKTVDRSVHMGSNECDTLQVFSICSQQSAAAVEGI
jgi:hypothetical protein